MLHSASTTSATRAYFASTGAPRQILPPVERTFLAASRPRGRIARRLLASRPLATTSSAPPPPPNPPRRRLSPLLASSAALLLAASGFYLHNSREPEPVLSVDRWTPVKIRSITPLTPETSLFRLEVPKSVFPAVLGEKGDPSARPVLSLFVKEPSLQIQRAYTPLSATSFDPSGPTTLDLVIKRYPDGETSRYLHRLQPGDEMIVRGPAVTWFYRPQDWDEVVFVVGGTGVSPACQLLADTLSSSSASASSASPSPALSIVYASPSPSRILLKPELDALSSQAGKDVKVQYLVDNLDPETGKKGLPEGVLVGMLDKKKLEKVIGKGGRGDGKRRVVVVCGPEGMVNAVAGPRGRNFSQGPVGGILGELGYKQGEVVKL
ncbi:hypothetical protein JCM8547_004955 [Rhodosporidiobolus lusitaniae]